MTANGRHSRVILLLCLISTAACNMSAFTEEPSERVGKSDGYCSRILRAKSNRKEVNNEFRLRVEGDPESYQPGSTYRGWRLSARFTHTAPVGIMCTLSNEILLMVSRECKLNITLYKVYFSCNDNVFALKVYYRLFVWSENGPSSQAGIIIINLNY